MKKSLKRLEVSARRLLFKAVSSSKSGTSPPGRIPKEETLRRILIMRQDRIGDMIVTLPLLRRLREVHSECSIGVVASESNRIVLRYEPGLKVIPARKDPMGFLASLAEARQFSPDVVVDMHMHDSTTSFVYGLFSGAEWKVHVSRENRLPFDVRVKAPMDCHIMETFAVLLSGLGRTVDLLGLDRRVRLSRAEREFAANFWRSISADPADFAAVNVSAGGSNRRWDSANYAMVCSRLLKQGVRVIVTYQPGDRETAEAVQHRASSCIVAPCTSTILHLAALIKGMRLLVSPDTSTIHLAASMDIPVVGMYLPFDPSLPRWHPWGVRSEVLMARDSSSLRTLSPEKVADAAERMLLETVEGVQ